ASSMVAKAQTNGGQLEGTIDLMAAFGAVPQTIYIAAAAYQTADATQTPGSGLLAAQGPAGNGDGNIDVNEFLQLPIIAIRDENADGKYDRLDPALGFVVSQIFQNGGITTI